MPYKRPQIVRTLESLIENESIRDVDPTTKRLVARCMSGDWCVQFRKANPATPTDRKFTIYEEEIRRGDGPGLDAVSKAGSPQTSSGNAQQGQLGRMDSVRGKHAKASRSAEHLPLPPGASLQKPRAVSGHHSTHRASDHARKDSVSRVRQLSGDSSTSLPRVAAASTSAASSKHRYRAGSFNVDATTTSFSSLSVDPRANGETIHIIDASSPLTDDPPEIRVLSPTSPGQAISSSPLDRSLSSSASSSSSSLDTLPKPASPSGRRAAPPPPVKTRRKPPAVPVRKGQLSPSGGSPLSAIAASSQPNLPALSAGKASAY